MRYANVNKRFPCAKFKPWHLKRSLCLNNSCQKPPQNNNNHNQKQPHVSCSRSCSVMWIIDDTPWNLSRTIAMLDCIGGLRGRIVSPFHCESRHFIFISQSGPRQKPSLLFTSFSFWVFCLIFFFLSSRNLCVSDRFVAVFLLIIKQNLFDFLFIINIKLSVRAYNAFNSKGNLSCFCECGAKYSIMRSLESNIQFIHSTPKLHT